jgi:hypothetical protein
MSIKQNKVMSGNKGNASNSGMLNLPDEFLKKFENLAPVRPEIYYYKPEVDGQTVPICGILLERREWTNQDGEKSTNFVLALTLPAILTSPGNPEPSEKAAGSFAYVKEWADLRELNRYLPVVGQHGFESVSEVLIVPKSSVKLPNGKPMRKFEIRARRMEASDSPVQLMAAPTRQPAMLEAAGDDMLPF